MESPRAATAHSYTRSFGGCDTCRSRHVKCDESRPTCSMCQYLGLKCAGYRKDIFFDFENRDHPAEIRFRRPLLTEQEREKMSQWLTSSVPPKSTVRMLSQIDEECERVSMSHAVQVMRGPFGAFRWRPNEAAPPRGHHLPSGPGDVVSPVPVSDDASITNINAISAEAPLSPRSEGLMQSIFDQSEQAPASSSPDFLGLLGNPAGVVNAAPAFQDHAIQPLTPDPDLNTLLSVSSVPQPPRTVPQDAVPLLNHYASTVIRLMTPFRHTKTPWHVLFIPHVKACLAALTLGEDLPHAGLCAFYGTLAISALSLGGISESRAWTNKGVGFSHQAQQHAMAMLETAYDVPKVAKYKSTLMALLTMVQMSMFSGKRDDVEVYFLEAEKFIRLRGLHRKKSRKVRLLHHCYVFERMFHESTFLSAANSIMRHRVRRSIEASGMARYSYDSLSFRLHRWSNLDQEMSKVRDREEAENDLHLERPGIFYATLYPEIFGIPEPWMFLLSAVIRLGNEKEAAEQHDVPNSLPLKEFLRRAKAIEDCINHLKRPSQYPVPLPKSQSEIVCSILDHMLEGLQHALAIYFYRRIYDVDASVLQQKVITVRDCLVQCELLDSTVVCGSAGFIWPAFIAACEAEDPTVQGSFSDWFQKAFRRSGLSLFTDTLENIEQVWQEKRSSDGKSVTWLDLMRNTAPLRKRQEQITCV